LSIGARSFRSCEGSNSAQILRAIKNGQVECVYQGAVTVIEQGGQRARRRARHDRGAGRRARWSPAQGDHAAGRRIPSRNFVESIGVRFLSPESDALPISRSHYETNVPGVFVIGALAGYPLIKQAMNQGYEVIEYLLGTRLERQTTACCRRSLGALRIGGAA